MSCKTFLHYSDLNIFYAKCYAKRCMFSGNSADNTANMNKTVIHSAPGGGGMATRPELSVWLVVPAAADVAAAAAAAPPAVSAVALLLVASKNSCSSTTTTIMLSVVYRRNPLKLCFCYYCLPGSLKKH